MQPLPMFPEELHQRTIKQCDFILITGDAYVDHPSFGAAVIGRVLEDAGFTVGIIAQPDWNSSKDILRLGLPKLGFLVTSGNMDSMVAHFSSTKRRRKRDEYSPGGAMGRRPDRATLVYSALLRQYAPGIPIILGGIEASLRRFSHYDYWSNKVRRSILLDSRADILIYGMGERATLGVAEQLALGIPIEEITQVAGTAFITKSPPENIRELPSYKEVTSSNEAYARSYRVQEEYTVPWETPLGECYENRWVVQNPPMEPLSTKEMDRVYGLPFTRHPHPSYKEEIPAIQEVSLSIISSRGCFGGCSFCALRFHQGRVISSRSKGSIIREAKIIIQDPRFKGYIHDVGGPTANFYKGPCSSPCNKRECLFPKPCKNLEDSQTEYFDILRAVRKIPRVKKVFVRSGIRYDYLLHHQRTDLIEELAEHHVSGQLKIAPEHVAKSATSAMRKPDISVYKKFTGCFQEACKKSGKKQYVIPYLISGHPGTTLEDALEMALFLKTEGFIPDQVQDFYPTPGTRSTTMYYTGLVPETLNPIHIPSEHEKHLQRGLIHFHKEEHRKTVLRALQEMGRKDMADILRPYGKSYGKRSGGTPNLPRGAGKSKGSSKRSGQDNRDGFAKGTPGGKTHRQSFAPNRADSRGSTRVSSKSRKKR